MVWDRFIDGQAECALLRHLDSFGSDTQMRDIVDSCRVWESHNEATVRRQDGSDRNSPRAVYHVTEDSCVTRCVDRIGEPQPVIQQRSKLTDMEIVLQNLLPVGSIVEEDVPSSESLEGCFAVLRFGRVRG